MFTVISFFQEDLRKTLADSYFEYGASLGLIPGPSGPMGAPPSQAAVVAAAAAAAAAALAVTLAGGSWECWAVLLTM